MVWPWRASRLLSPPLAFLLLHAAVSVTATSPAMPSTPLQQHSAGMCTMYGQCGPRSDSWFAPPLNCPASIPAPTAEGEHLELFERVCGAVLPPPLPSSNSTAPPRRICCDTDQLNTLQSSLHPARALLSSCPACLNNLVAFFCHMTCSPDQSTFSNVSATIISPRTGHPVVTNLTVYVDAQFGDGWFQSCEGVKFPADNRPVMDLLGGGASSWGDMVRFLGEERFGGSPFTIHFPMESPSSNATGMQALNPEARRCDGGSLDARCSCVDCNTVCPVLAPLPDTFTVKCSFLGVSCLAWSLVIIYAAIFIATFTLLDVLRRYGGSVSIRHPSALVAAVLGRPPPRSNAGAGGSRFRSSTYSNEPPVALSEEDARIMAPAPLSGFGVPPPPRSASPYFQRRPPQPPPPLHDAHAAHAFFRDHARRRLRFDMRVQAFFHRLGYRCAHRPLRTISLTALLVIIISAIGWPSFRVARDPIELWVAPDSRAFKEKAIFDHAFGPFYRTQQLLMMSESDHAPVVSYENLELLFNIQAAIGDIHVPDLGSGNATVGLADLCFKPTGDACVIQSVTGYFQDDVTRMHPSSWREEVRNCANHPVSCLPRFRQPIRPDLVFGGVGSDMDYLNAKALVVTYVLSNSLNVTNVERARRWESALLAFFHDIPDKFNTTGVRFSFSTEVSVEQELNHSNNTDARTVIISYIVMLLYASLALGRLHRAFASSFPALRILVETRFMLGIAGILIVISSVSVAVAIFSFAGYKTSLIIAEVIPFLVLAIGVDNVFVLVGEFDRQTLLASEQEGQGVVSVEERCALTLGRMGPSILVTALTQVIAFALGGVVGMPAVSSFAAYSALAVGVDAVLQVTCFISFLALDAHRQEANLADLIPCLRLPPDDSMEWEQEAPIRRFIRAIYSPLVLNRSLKPFVCLAYLGWFFASIFLIGRMSIGLDQRVALPDDSYLNRYFSDMTAYFRTGPPVYFVAHHSNITARNGQRAVCGRFSTCNTFSMANVLEQERKRPESSYLAQPAAIWLDDFFHWLNPMLETCCRFKRGTNHTAMCHPEDDESECESCLGDQKPAWNITLDGLPQGEDFDAYLSRWMEADPEDICPLGGRAAYRDAISILPPFADSPGERVFHARTYHTPLHTQQDYIEALRAARRVAAEIQESNPGLRVFPYSVFYVFFEQYLGIVSLTVRLLLLALLVVGFVTWALLGSLSTALCVCLCVVATVVDVAGLMTLFGVSLNAISLVNLMICVGIAVEFSCHIARSFLVEQGGRNQRAHRALVHVGGSVVSGITLTKLVGISVLAFSRSKIFVVYYFRMYMAIVCVSAVHGLVLLPILLSLIGGDGPVKLPGARRPVFLSDTDDSDDDEAEDDRSDRVIISRHDVRF